MCGRYVIAPPDEEILRMIREINRTKLAEMFREINQPPITGAGEILPSSVVHVIATSRTGEQKLRNQRSGKHGRNTAALFLHPGIANGSMMRKTDRGRNMPSGQPKKVLYGWPDCTVQRTGCRLS